MKIFRETIVIEIDIDWAGDIDILNRALAGTEEISDLYERVFDSKHCVELGELSIKTRTNEQPNYLYNDHP